MPPLSVLIKPSSSACNMCCAYCFYKDEASKRETACHGMLSLKLLEEIIREALTYAERICAFVFQGGEPTLVGLDFFRKAVEIQQKYQRKDTIITNAIQTNGYRIDDEWAAFFAEHKFLVGVSLDGPADIHNQNRKNTSGSGTFNRVMQTTKLFRKYGVEYNILSVVTGRSAKRIESIYRFFRKHDFRWLQFIPCLDPLEEERGAQPYSLTVSEYGQFLVRIFDLWYEDLQNGVYVSIRHIDNWLHAILGHPVEACNMTGRCSVQFVIEGDGSVYPCDFYVLDQWKIGTIGTQSFQEMQECEVAQKFIADSLYLPDTCKKCPYLQLCRNGCRRDRSITVDGRYDRNYYCDAYRHFFANRGAQMYAAATQIVRSRR